MAPKQKKALPEPEKFDTGDIVLCKVKGYPEWPGKIVDASTASEDVRKARAGKAFCVRFFPDGDYAWFGARELKALSTKAIDAFASDSSKKSGKLREGYLIAKDPAEWEAEQARRAAEEPEDDDEEEDVDMLAEDGEEKVSAGKKRKRAAAADKAKKDAKAKTDGAAAKKRKTDDKSDKKPDKKTAKIPAASSKDKKSAAAPTGEDSEGAKTVKGWRATLQKAFLTKGVPEESKMPDFDKLFKDMESFEMQSEWLTQSKLGKVLKRMSVLPDIVKEAEYKIKERSAQLIEKWKEMMVKEGGDDTTAGGAGDTTMADADDSKKAEVPAEKPKEDEAKKVEINGTNGQAHPDEKMETDAPATTDETAAAPAS